MTDSRCAERERVTGAVPGLLRPWKGVVKSKHPRMKPIRGAPGHLLPELAVFLPELLQLPNLIDLQSYEMLWEQVEGLRRKHHRILFRCWPEKSKPAPFTKTVEDAAPGPCQAVKSLPPALLCYCTDSKSLAHTWYF